MPLDNPRRSSSGSQKRQCTHSLQIMLTRDQRALVDALAEAAGLSASAYGKSVLFGTPGPRAQRRPTANAVILGKLMAALHRSGNVLMQLDGAANAGFAASIADEIRAAVAGNRAACAALREASGRREPLDAAMLDTLIVSLKDSGNVLNELAHALNAGISVSIGHKTRAALIQNRAASAAIAAAVGLKHRHDTERQSA